MIYIEDYLNYANVDYKASGKNVGSNDININCPWCGESREHLGINTLTAQLNCWSCGFYDLERWPDFVNLIMVLEDRPYKDALEILDRFSDNIPTEDGYIAPKMAKSVQLPRESKQFYAYNHTNVERNSTTEAMEYLKRRGYSIGMINKYGLKYCETGYFAGRIIVPVYFGGKLVSFLGRDYLGREEERYKNCPLSQCIMRFKETLYNWDNFTGKHLRLVEGVTDVHQLGNSSMAVFKSKVSREQLSLIVSLDLDSISIMFDRDAYSRALTFGEDISPFINKVKVVEMGEKDVADLGYDEIIQMEENTPDCSF